MNAPGRASRDDNFNTVRLRHVFSLAVLLLAACGAADPGDSTARSARREPDQEAIAVPSRTTPVVLKASDGVTVYGVRHSSPRPRAVILLFHQAGSSHGEYTTIAPRLAALGFDTLAIDQRSGGEMFGPNRTAAALGRSATYLDAELDLEAAFAWARGQRLPIILWGSSYSAALVFRVAERHASETKAVLAFSPGEYLGAPTLVRTAAAKVIAPVFVAAASDPSEAAAARIILSATKSTIKVSYLPGQDSIHGASMLIVARNPRGESSAWRAVEDFLGRVG